MTTVPWRNLPWAPTPGSSVSVRSTGPLHIYALGDFAVMRGDAPVELGQHQARDLLAILICAQGPVHRDKLIEWLWPHLPEERALSTLYSTVYTLRQRLEPGAPTRLRSRSSARTARRIGSTGNATIPSM